MVLFKIGIVSQLQGSSRARTYNLYARFKFQPYLDIIKNTRLRIALSRLRVSAHRLEIETGRWHKPLKIPYTDRKCLICKTLEDEFHFLLECPLYIDLRKRYIKEYFWRNANVLKFTELLNNDNKVIIQKLSLYVLKSFELRTQYLNRIM
jgi:hypothetical protein